MPTITVAEALARIDTYRRRLEKKQQLVSAYLFRQGSYRDPLAALGGSTAVLTAELASMHALQEGHIRLRRQIQNAYENTLITFGEQTRSLADWLAWRREVACRRIRFQQALSRRIQRARLRAQRQAAQSMAASTGKAADIVVHLNEQELEQQSETTVELLGYLSGQLALKNATVTIDADEEVARTELEERLEQKQWQQASAPPAPDRVPPWSTSPELCRLARDPVFKIAAIKMYRELTGVGLKEAKDAVEAFAAMPD